MSGPDTRLADALVFLASASTATSQDTRAMYLAQARARLVPLRDAVVQAIGALESQEAEVARKPYVAKGEGA